MDRRKLGSFALCVMFFALGNSVEAQQPKKVPRTAYLSSLDPNSERARSEAIRLALRERGYIEGSQLSFKDSPFFSCLRRADQDPADED